MSWGFPHGFDLSHQPKIQFPWPALQHIKNRFTAPLSLPLPRTHVRSTAVTADGTPY